jgi:hypothetical protein
MKFRAFVIATTLSLTGGLATHARAQAPASNEVRGPVWFNVTATTSDSPETMQSIEVKAPADGNLTITVTGTLMYSHTKGTTGKYCLQLSDTSDYVGGCNLDAGSDSAIRSDIAAGEPTTKPNGGVSVPYSIVRSWPVKAGVTYTFYLNGYAGGLQPTWLFQPAITAIYLPGTLLP